MNRPCAQRRRDRRANLLPAPAEMALAERPTTPSSTSACGDATELASNRRVAAGGVRDNRIGTGTMRASGTDDAS